MFPVLAGNSASTGYNLTRSLRVRASASGYLNRTPSSAGNRQTWTWSGWVKRGTLGTSQGIFAASTSGSALAELYFNTSNALSFYDYTGAYNLQLITTQVFRDPSAWYHIVVVLDTTNATAANRVKIYVNGAQVTALSTATYPSQNYQGYVNNNIAHYTSSYNGSIDLYDGYLAEVNFVDGQALTPSSFGSFNALTGVWQPARYTGTYGTNGFYLPFTDNSALTTSSNVGLGKDFSGNGNYWTTNNISITAGVTYDSMTDVPTLTSATAANFATTNPLQYGSYVTLSNGNLTVTGNTSANSALALATIGNLTSGKWYWEYTQGTVQSETCGICTQNMAGVSLINGENIASYGIGVRANGDVYGGTVSTITSWTVGDVIGIAVDCDNGAAYWSKNGTWSNSGVPTSGASKTGAVGVWTPSTTKIITPAFGAYNGGFVSPTFGQRPFAYTPPTGFVSLNTFNLPDSTIVKGNTVMDATLYTGAGNTSSSITNAAGFKPDFVWMKARSIGYNNYVYDSVRGTGTSKSLVTSLTDAEGTNSSNANLSSFDSTGWTIGTTSGTNALNASGQTFVGWQWQAGQGSTASNTNGSITSTVSVNASAGFSVVTYTGTGANATVGHGLGVAPSLVIVKARSFVQNWLVYHQSLGNTNAMFLDLTNASTANSLYWNNTSPTSSVVSLGSGNGVNSSGNTYVAYCWTPIAGYSAFGSYTGNGSTDGTFVYTGFRPRWVLIKMSSSIGDWYLYDSARDPYNATQQGLLPNSSASETTYTGWGDLLSNGFKIRRTDAAWNSSGGTYIYMAFAETPFKNSLGR